MERLGSVWECPDYFRLDGKDVLLFSPPDVQAQGNELHNGNNAIYVVGTYDHAKKQFQMQEERSQRLWEHRKMRFISQPVVPRQITGH